MEVIGCKGADLSLLLFFRQRPNAWSIWAGRTGARSAAGKIQPRWQEAIRWAAAIHP